MGKSVLKDCFRSQFIYNDALLIYICLFYSDKKKENTLSVGYFQLVNTVAFLKLFYK